MRALGILVTAPIPGRVKLRLAGDVGPSTATEVYWRLGRRVVEAVAGSGLRTVIWFTPAAEGAYVREWLDGVGRVEFRPQSEGHPGQRWQDAFARHFAEGARRVVVVATDFPGLDRRLVVEAFTALGPADLVLGPATDGGLYLVGLRQPHRDLFAGISWTAGAARVQIQARARGLGLEVRGLKPLRPVDTLQDARVLGLLNS
ncbi:MAG TPA: TIGR04282 family arsenosugar biosynthesis glycosyltransferase [Gemmatimonadales bacterium]|nr:TIGR04282 family arsenosugar biosynthesis glycosyltransferase [Gemmatimonadales bacterium]